MAGRCDDGGNLGGGMTAETMLIQILGIGCPGRRWQGGDCWLQGAAAARKGSRSPLGDTYE